MDNPSAFPTAHVPLVRDAEPGMSLRDWFAGQVLCGLLADPGLSKDHGLHRTGNPHAVIASAAYAMADAMLAERSKR